MPYSSPTANPFFIGNSHYPHGDMKIKNAANNKQQKKHRGSASLYLPSGTPQKKKPRRTVRVRARALHHRPGRPGSSQPFLHQQ